MNFQRSNDTFKKTDDLRLKARKIVNWSTVPIVGNTAWGSSSLESQSSWDTQRSEREAQHICSWIGSYSVALLSKMKN